MSVSDAPLLLLTAHVPAMLPLLLEARKVVRTRPESSNWTSCTESPRATPWTGNRGFRDTPCMLSPATRKVNQIHDVSPSAMAPMFHVPGSNCCVEREAERDGAELWERAVSGVALTVMTTKAARASESIRMAGKSEGRKWMRGLQLSMADVVKWMHRDA